MPHLYICHQCRTRAPKRWDRREGAEADQQQHRDDAHGGHVPIGGDGIETVHADSRGDGLLPRHTFFAVLFLLALVLANCWRG
ncbi:hypothetical protein [Streptomyces cavernae]|uniref:hypothetical protein n=1 Tax=Streptomyces cavernae TaxID=2259034 RepID=UPI000FEBC351|nr:hypothetical protein [Streptomyces cavernae]